jgi:drug/metabolite transporter (DMT)-like permease
VVSAGFFMSGKLKYYIILHVNVLVLGFTGILGDLISLPAELIVFFRTGISFLSLILIGFFISRGNKLAPKEMGKLLLIGAIVGLHWYSFFYAIKISTVSIAVVCMSSSTLFTAILEPIVFKRKFRWKEMLLSLTMIGGITIIFGFESDYYLGIVFGLIGAFLAAVFTVFNGKFVSSISSFKITIIEMLGAFITLLIILSLSGKIEAQTFYLSGLDWLYLGVLGIICTSIAFLVSVWVMKFVTPFTVSISINMEPIYTIIILLIMASFTGSEKENMSGGFYLGAAIIIASIFINAFFKRKSKEAEKINQGI